MTPHLIFLDFDGVIKESSTAKSEGWAKLFTSYGESLSERVVQHHQLNGGLSRFVKIPLYLRWAGIDPIPSVVAKFCHEYSLLVKQLVIDSAWVVGALELIRREHDHSGYLVIVTGTPQEEMESILESLGILQRFRAVYGSPTSKSEAIRTTLNNENIDRNHCLFVGDAIADLDAAMLERIPFILRLHDENKALFADYSGRTCENLLEITKEW